MQPPFEHDRGAESRSAARLRVQGLRYPEHGPTGWFLIGLFCCVGLGLLLIAPVGFLTTGESEPLALTPFWVGFGCLSFWVAYEIYRFECWTWFLLAGLIGRVLMEASLPRGSNAPLRAVLLLVWAVCLFGPVRYLWNRRLDFWFGGDVARRAINAEQNRHRWARRSWKDDARELKRRMAERAETGAPRNDHPRATLSSPAGQG